MANIFTLSNYIAHTESFLEDLKDKWIFYLQQLKLYYNCEDQKLPLCLLWNYYIISQSCHNYETTIYPFTMFRTLLRKSAYDKSYKK